jgi:hypothetical protein
MPGAQAGWRPEVEQQVTCVFINTFNMLLACYLLANAVRAVAG